MDREISEDAGQGRSGALEALREAAQEPDVMKDFPKASAAFQPEDYEQIVALAWRYQFYDDRSMFKRQIRELEQHVSPRIVAQLQEFE